MDEKKLSTLLRQIKKIQEKRLEAQNTTADLVRALVSEACKSNGGYRLAVRDARCYHVLRRLGLPTHTVDPHFWSKEYRMAAKWADALFEEKGES